VAGEIEVNTPNASVECRLRLRGVTKRYGPGEAAAVRDVSLAVGPGEVLALVGPSGSGKTTLLRLVAGFERPEAGQVEIDGRLVQDGDRELVPVERRGVGVVFQQFALFPHLDVAGNVTFGLAGWRRARRRARLGELLALCGLDGLAHRFPHELSGGQQQRVALARALAPGRSLVLLDEPLASVDPLLRTQLRADLRRLLRDLAATAILVTHDRDEALELGDRVGVMREGALVQVGAPAEVTARPADAFVADFVGGHPVLHGVRAGEIVWTALDPAPPGGLARAGRRVRVVFRAEHLAARPDPAGTAIVEAVTWRGGRRVLRVRLVTGESIACDAGPAVGVHGVGEPVSVSATAPPIAVFEGDGGPAPGPAV
jgi:iron(III) transport system ATP-binding protein